jgi:5-oxopent-3-ene-1,2,5-tricarboxylate decarboxylase/2-hydroxyhepta-2,4-diene-1,7-dioate isomerase
MVNDVAASFEYLGRFMTLSPGDVILPGTPEGVVNVNVADWVVTQIQSVGRRANPIVADANES